MCDGAVTLKADVDSAAQPHFYFPHAQVLLLIMGKPLQVYIIHAHDFASVDVNNLAVEQVLTQKQEGPICWDRLPFRIFTELQDSARRLTDLCCGDQPVAVSCFQHQSNHTSCLCTGANCNVLEPTAYLPAHVRYRRTNQRAKAVPIVLLVHGLPCAV